MEKEMGFPYGRQNSEGKQFFGEMQLRGEQASGILSPGLLRADYAGVAQG
jgi:hypothetical protein